MTASCGDLRDRLLEHIMQAQLFPRPGVAVLAVSGGPDSVALLDLMVAVREDLDLNLAVAHIDHGISAAASAAAPHVAELAQRYSLPYHSAALELGATASETLAREERYRALRDIQGQIAARYLVTAHQADDQAETVLYRLLKGTGVFGLAGIPQRGPDGLVRPLLPFTRRELEAWLEQRFSDPHGGPILLEDPANIDERHDRAWLRHAVMPLLEARLGADLETKLGRTAADAAADRRAWAALLRTLDSLEFRQEQGMVEVARAPLERYDKALSERLLRALALEVKCVLGPQRATRLREFAANSGSGRRFELGAGWIAELTFDCLRILRADPGRSLEGRTVAWGHGERGCTRWDGWEFAWQTEPARASRRSALSAWVTLGAGEIRAPQAGDKLVPLGGIGHRKVRRILMEARVPSHERPGYPVVVRGSDVIWIPGICRSAEALPRVGELAVRLDARATKHR
jgi:tRNA(Ile)-lysidine synthase